ncbi:MAG: carboxypeptidase regulatory-like domain-containing protein [Gemmatimonadaceae bacterium]
MSFVKCTCLSFVLGSTLFATAIGAQSAAPRSDVGAIVSGVVHDSIANANLSGATIQLVASADPSSILNAVSDSLGHFRMTEVPLGHYRIGFFHPLLDSLGVEAPLRDVYVDSYGSVTANVGVPSAATLRRAMCESEPGGAPGAVIVGTVRSAHDGLPMPKVAVFGEWYEYVLKRTGTTRQLARRNVTSGDNGWFALCNAPTEGSVALIATTGTDSTGIIEVQIPSTGFARRELYLGASETEPVVDSARPPVAAAGAAPTGAPTAAPVPVRRIRVGNGHVSGTVTTVAESRPLANATVTIVDGPQTHTDALGHWVISNAPAGTRAIEVRALGYYPDRREINVVASAQPLHIALSTLKAMLDTVKIRASRLPGGANGIGFNYRRRASAGRFITPEDIQRLPVVVTSELFRRMPGVNADEGKIQMRGAFATWCEAAIFIDDHYMSFLTTEDIDDWVHPEHIAGIEVYSESSVPAQFRVGMGECGSIVIWTK